VKLPSNTKISFAKNSEGVLEIIDTNNYYPFGLNHISNSFSNSGFGSFYSYKYNDKELQETGLFDYGARMLMPDLGRWGAMDAMSEKYSAWSPYNYAINNPVMVIDPDGNDIMFASGEAAKFALKPMLQQRLQVLDHREVIFLRDWIMSMIRMAR
jgi:RHS repeat-associated protein